MLNVPVNVLLRKDIIAQKSPGLSFSGNISHPVQASVSISGIARMVLEPAPIRIYHQQPVIADSLSISYLVPVHACFPGPLAHRHLLAIRSIELHSIGKLREDGLLRAFPGIPLDRSAHDHIISFHRRGPFAIFVARLPAHRPVGARQKTDSAVTGAVREKPSMQTDFLARFDMHSRNRLYLRSFRIHSNHMIRSIQVNVFLRIYELLLFPILIALGRTGIAFLRMPEFPDHPSQPLIRFHLHVTAEVHANLRTVVAAQNRPVIHESDLQSVPRSSRSRAHAGNTAACNHKIIIFVNAFALDAPKLLNVSRFRGTTTCKQHGIASAVESCHVMQTYLRAAAFYGHCAGILPFP